jgi:2-phospho-L-lactate/phosphoenolpyruvate guanylyltransferase
VTGDAVWAIVPVKRFAAAKRRLRQVLSSAERQELAQAMMRDVLSAVAEYPAIAGVVVVTCDEKAAGIAAAAGAEVVRAGSDEGYTAAADAGVAALRGRATTALILSTDIPLVRGEDLARLASMHGLSPAVTVARAAVDEGTNALVLSPPDIIGFQFGPASEARHVAAGRCAGATVRSVTLPRMAFDIDRPEDVARFLRAPSPTLTYGLLWKLQVEQRLARGPVASAGPRESPAREGEMS